MMMTLCINGEERNKEFNVLFLSHEGLTRLKVRKMISKLCRSNPQLLLIEKVTSVRRIKLQ